MAYEARLPRTFVTRVRGVSFCENYPWSMGELEALARRRMFRGESGVEMEAIPCVLRRNPENAHDPNACEVHVPSLGQQIGHVDRNTARLLAPSLDSGERWLAAITEVVTHPDHPDRPGISVRLTRAPEGGSGIS